MDDKESNKRKSSALPESDDIFMSEERWQECRDQGSFDYVVIGSSFCAWAFSHHILLKNPKANILILECGEYRPENFENHTPSKQRKLTYSTKKCPWNITKKMQDGKYIKELDGVNNFFGGQSAFWRGWCPKPTRKDLDGWPESVKDVIEEYFPLAVELLNVKSADNIGVCDGDHRVFGELQNVLVEKIQSCLPEGNGVNHALLAVRKDKPRYERVQKTSVAAPLLKMLREKKLEIKIGCEVKKIVHENCKAVSLETNKGDVKLGNAKLILAMGVLPPTTLMLNSFSRSSFQSLSGIGSRFTAHFRSSILARVPIHDNAQTSSLCHALRNNISERFEVAAMHISGLNTDPKSQYHIQLSAILNDTPTKGTETAELLYPDVVPAVLAEKQSSSKDPPYIRIVCKTIGGLDYANENNWFCLDSEVPRSEVIIRKNDVDVPCNTTLQAVSSEVDLQLWDTMEEFSFRMLEKLGDCSEGTCQLEYWHDAEESWRIDRPSRDESRRERLVHPASTMWIGDDESSSPVDLNYRFRGIENVYLTGGALWPVAGSLNPTCIMVALAMDLADKLLTNVD